MAAETLCVPAAEDVKLAFIAVIIHQNSGNAIERNIHFPYCSLMELAFWSYRRWRYGRRILEANPATDHRVTALVGGVDFNRH